MSDRMKNIIIPIELFVISVGLVILLIIIPPEKYSDSERRLLAKAPELTADNILSAKYMEEIEDYALDHFPLRDKFRSIKAVFAKDIFLKKDNNGIYLENGYLNKTDYPVNYPMLDHAADCINYINEKYLKDKDIVPYVVIIPDKSHYMKGSSLLNVDYNTVFEYEKKQIKNAKFIEIEDLLSLDSYYRTDTHWRQEKIKPVADRILEIVKADAIIDFKISTLERPFYGVYYSQSALNIEPDTMSYITNKEMENCIVTNYDTGKPKTTAMYNFDKLNSGDLYEMFLDGSSALIMIENPAVNNKKELVVFRDSFGSSLAPYFINGYEKITLVDIRYINPAILDKYVDFTNTDVIYIYNTILLNNSLGMKKGNS